MHIKHFILAILVAAIWGCNFIFVKFSLDEISPLMLSALRFILASFPAILFIKPPSAPFKLIALYGLITFGMQFSFLFIGMRVGMTPGLAALLMQVQIFFSMLFAMIFLNEETNRWQIIGALVSFTGIGLIATHFDNAISLLGFILIICAAASWGMGNLIIKKIGNVNMIALVIWGSFFASFPLVLLAFIFDGRDNIIQSLSNISWLGVASVLFIVYASTWVGYGIWNWLINRYAVGIVVPFTLLVPVFGMISSVLILDEPFQLWKIIAGFLVITGLGINLLGPRLLIGKMQFKKEMG